MNLCKGDQMLKEGTKAPDFTLPDQNGTMHSLKDYKGHKVILYFYSKDMTSGCSKQACGFAERNPQFLEKGAVILGVSKDTVESHKRFAERYGIPFAILADPDFNVLKAYDVVKMKKTDTGEKLQTIRTTYLIDEEGVIVKAIGKVKAADNPEEMLEML